ncbi:ATP-binding protein [Photobacterium sp. 1_MG-2023]|uniref:sensor histidine kinase n=1 Tax=Photobacterium sp. 1_MG-2023 TaxID=3062646 RepID=UPI0026E28DD6|nr:ATP-binding protein [Photobacterium sp. 1_MG-2023]MDO6705069.1 ATP-binding protein [Photobacterium sp. 1_MG-2023]
MKTTETKPLLSIKKRLIILTVAASALLIAISWSLIFAEAKHEIHEIYDARLSQSAKLLALSAPQLLQMPSKELERFYDAWYLSISSYAGQNDDVPTPYGHPYEQKLMFQFFNDSGEVLLRSTGAPATPLTTANQLGYHPITFKEQHWRSFLILVPEPANQHIYLVVAEHQDVRNELINEIALSTGIPQLLLVPCFAIAIILLVYYVMKPVGELQQALSKRTVHKLHAIHVTQPTVELSPLINQLNFLLHELDKAWAREKRFTHTAAHELKTPLAVLRLNAENALASDNPEDLHSDLAQILKGIERTDRLIQQLLMLTKVEGNQSFQYTRIDLMACLRESIASLAPLALKQQQTLSLDGPEQFPLDANDILLTSLFSNLIDNAIRYAGDGADITVQVTASNHDSVSIRVCDTGPAIPDAIRERIFEKFFRANTERGDGAGLGMSIIRDIAQIHGGEIQLEGNQSSPMNCFRVTLPTHRKPIEL